jgi:hypothetical protein
MQFGAEVLVEETGISLKRGLSERILLVKPF